MNCEISACAPFPTHLTVPTAWLSLMSGPCILTLPWKRCRYRVHTPSVRIDQVSTHPSSLINRASLQSLIAVSHCSLSSIECHQSINHRSMGIARPIYASTYKKRRLAYARLAIYGCLPSPAAAVGDDGPVALGARLVRDDPRVEWELDGVLVEDAHRVE